MTMTMTEMTTIRVTTAREVVAVEVGRRKVARDIQERIIRCIRCSAAVDRKRGITGTKAEEEEEEEEEKAESGKASLKKWGLMEDRVACLER